MKELVELLIKEKWLNLSSSDAEVKIALWNFTGNPPSEQDIFDAWSILQEMSC